MLAATVSVPLRTAAQEISSPATDPREILSEQIARGLFGPIELSNEVEFPVSITVEGKGAYGYGEFWLVEPEAEVVLRATLEEPKREDAPQAAESAVLIRQTRHHETLWQGGAGSRFAAGANDSVIWYAGSGKGEACPVTVTVATLNVDRTVNDLAAVDRPTPAILHHGKAGLLLLRGVTFDREGDGMLQGQNIGIYPDESGAAAPNTVKENAKLYGPPATFYQIDEKSRGLAINQHMTLGQLEPPAFPDEAQKARFVAISPRLVEFLPVLQTKMTEGGLDPAQLKVLRAYISPTERQRLERAGVSGLAEYTRYQYGDALALVYGSEGRMTDVNADGKTDVTDAETLAAVIKKTMDEKKMYGGLGIGASFKGLDASKGTPYVHLDLRGFYTPFREE